MKEIVDFKPVVIGVDHGYGNIKTAHSIFKAGVDKLQGEAIASENVLEYKRDNYIIGESHMTYLDSKTTNEDYRVLTLAGIAEELTYLGFSRANIILAVGLPLSWVASQKAEFRKYLSKESDLNFKYRGREFEVHIDQVFIFPQGLAEVGMIENLVGHNMVLDIGNGTMNIAQIYDGKALESSLVTEKYGVGICIQEIQKVLSKKLATNVTERRIEDYLINGCEEQMNEISKTVRAVAENYTKEIIKRLSVHGYDSGYTKLHVFGGGGCLLKNYGAFTNNDIVYYYDDINANAKGYEQLARMKIGVEGRKAS